MSAPNLVSSQEFADFGISIEPHSALLQGLAAPPEMAYYIDPAVAPSLLLQRTGDPNVVQVATDSCCLR